MAAPSRKRRTVEDVEHLLASEVDPRPITFLAGSDGRIPEGMLTGVFGRPGVSKSLYAAKIAADVSHHGGVIFSAMEDPAEQVVRPRLEVAGANLDNVALWTPRLPDDLPHLRKMIAAYDAKLVVLDPINAHLTVRATNDQAARQATTPLFELAQETGCSFLFIGHTLKRVSATKHILEVIAGSGAGIVGACRAVYVYTESGDDSDEKALVCAKISHNEEPPPLIFEIDTKDYRYNERVERPVPFLVKVREDESVTKQKAVEWMAGSGKNQKRDEKKSKAAQWATEYLLAAHEMGVERKSSEVVEDARQVGITASTLRRALKEAGAVAERRGGAAENGWWVTMLPDDHPAFDDEVMLGFDDEADGDDD